MTLDEIMKELTAGKYRPVYLLMGDEPYPIDVVSDYIEEHALTEAEKSFNQTIIYGQDTSGQAIGLECDQYPTFASRRVVIVKEAQGTANLKDLEGYVSHALETTVLVLCHKYKSVDKRMKLIKAIEKTGGAILETKKLYDNQMPHWIASYAMQQGLKIETRAAELLAEHVGTSQTDAVSAFEKIKAAEGERPELVTVDMIVRHVGVSKEYNAFELSDAIFARNKTKALRIVKAFGGNAKTYPIQKILAALHSSFQKLFNYTYVLATTGNAQKAAQATGGGSAWNITRTYEPASKNFTAAQCMRALSLINETDMKSKGLDWPETSNRDLMIDLVCQILS